MSWLGFANHFLSNQRLHVWSWINRIFSWEWCFLVGNSVLSVLGLFLFCFCLVRGEKVASAQDFGWQSKGEGHFGSWFPFYFVYLVTILYCSDIVWTEDLSGCFFFFRSLIENFSFFFCFLPLFHWEFSFYFVSSPFLGLGIFSFFLCLLPFWDWEFSFSLCFLPRARIDILTLGQGLW